MNWAWTSGGPGGAPVPDATDTVYFDANSTRDCPLNANAVCLSLNIAGYIHTLNINGRTLDIANGCYIVGGPINLTSGTIKVHANSTIRPSAVTTGTGRWLFELSSDILLKADRFTNLGLVEVTGGSAYTMLVERDVINGGLLCNSLVSDANIASTSVAYLDSYSWNLTGCALTAGSNVYFRGAATFSSVTVNPGGTYHIAASGTYDFDGVTFPNIQTTVGGKTVVFPSVFHTSGIMTLRPNDFAYFNSGSLYNFNVIAWNGAAGNLLTLGPTGATQWRLDVDDPSPTVTYVSVSYSDASVGSAIDATDGTSYNFGNNDNWLFPSSSSSSSSCSSSSCSSSCSSCSCSSCSCSSSSCSCSSSSCSCSSCSCSSSCSSSSCSCSSCSCSSSSCSCSSCSSSSSFSSSSFSSCSCSSSSISGSSFTAIATVPEAVAEAEGVTFIPASRIEEFLYNPFRGVPRFIFNRGYAISDVDMIRNQDLIKRAVGNHFTGLMKWPGIINRMRDSV